MLSPPLAVEILRSLRPLTRVLTPIGAGNVVVQMGSGVLVLLDGGATAKFERHQVEDLAATLRGLGRTAYRGGALAHEAIAFAADHVGRDLDAAERRCVMDGWVAERAEVSL